MPGGCDAKPEGVAIDKAQVGFAVTDVVDLAAVATDDAVLLSFAVDGNTGCREDGCYVFHNVFAVSAGATPPSVWAPPTSAVGISPSESAAPLVLDGELLLLTQGHAGAVPMPIPGQPWHGPADTLYLVRDSEVLRRSEKWFTGDFAAARAGTRALVVGAGNEAGGWRAAPANASVRTGLISRDAIGKGELVASAGDHATGDDTRYGAPAVVATADRAAIAYREETGPTPGARGRVFVAWVDPSTGKSVRKPVALASGDVGKPALLLDGDALHVVWAQRSTAAARYRLQHAVWRPGDAAPGPVSALPSATSSALAPSLARAGGGYAVAWMESGDAAHGSVHAGMAVDSIEHAVAAARRISSDDVGNARDPKWGEAGAHPVLAWTEHFAGGARVRWVRCQAPVVALPQP
jgi:hypothetical protein